MSTKDTIIAVKFLISETPQMIEFLSDLEGKEIKLVANGDKAEVFVARIWAENVHQAEVPHYQSKREALSLKKNIFDHLTN